MILRISDRRFHHHSRPSARLRRKKGAENQAIGRSRGGLSTKVHMVVRGLGCPVRFTLTAGQKGDAPQADGLIENMAADVVMADTAYDSDHLRQIIAQKRAKAIRLARALGWLCTSWLRMPANTGRYPPRAASSRYPGTSSTTSKEWTNS